MILGISEIQRLIKEQNLITDLSDRERNEPVGTVIELRLDKVFELKGEGFVGIEDRKTPEAIEVASYKEGESQIVTIKPGDYFLVKTIETINLPENLAGLFQPRSTLFRSGISFRSGFANPGFSGPLYFAINNASQVDFKIELGARFCCIYFMEIKGDIQNAYKGQWQGGRDAAVKLEKQI